MVGQVGCRLEALAWGDARLSLPSAISAPDGSTLPAASGSVDERRRAQVARIAGPVPDGAHPVPVSPVPHDKRSVIAHYRAMAEQVARERQLSGGAPHTLGRWV